MTSIYRLTTLDRKSREKVRDFSSRVDAIVEFHLLAASGKVSLVKVDEYDKQTLEHIKRLATHVGGGHAR